MGDVSPHPSRAWLVVALLPLVLGVGGCAHRPAPPAPGLSTLTGRVEVRAPVPSAAEGSATASYGDRRLRDATRVDYSRPGFAVVYVETDPPDPAPAEDGSAPARVTLSSGTTRLRVDPAELAMRTGAVLSIHNASPAAHVISIPELGRVTPIEAGEQIRIAVDVAGELSLYVLDHPGSRVHLFSAPGPFVRLPDSGRFALTDLPPGRRRLHAWHARLPPTSVDVELLPDRIEDVDLVLGARED